MSIDNVKEMKPNTL